MNVGIVGNGVVGSATAKALREHGNTVFVNDIVTNKGECTKEFIALNSDVVFICVPTPSGEGGFLNIITVQQVIGELWDTILHNQNIVIKTTVPVGTTDWMAELFPLLSFAYCPEFLRQNHAEEDAMNPHRIIIGSKSRQTSGLLGELFHDFDAPIFYVEPKVAEMAKLFSNAFLSTKVAFSQQILRACKQFGVEYFPPELLTSDPRMGDSHLDPYKGKVPKNSVCLPKDLLNLISQLENNNFLSSVYDEAIDD